jgi:hypothetical protein
MTDEIKECSRQVSIEAEKFNFLATRLLELRSATNLTASDKDRAQEPYPKHE